MPTLAERQTQACDGLAALIQAAWNPAAPDGISRDYVTEETFATLTGRQVFVFPTENGARTVERLNRSELLNEVKVSVRVLEKYTDAGRPTKAWVDQRVAFLDAVYAAMDTITPGAYLLEALWCQTLEITDVADAEAVDQSGVFFGSIEGSWREIVTG